MLKPVVKLCGGGAVWLIASCAAFAQQYSIATVAGGAPPTTPASAASTAIGQPRRVTTDSSGNIYFSSGNSVFKIGSGGTLALVAGNSRPGFSGDGGPAISAQLNTPQGLAVDSKGNIYIADSGNNRIRIVTSAGIINTFAGNGQIGTPRFLGDAGPATSANLQLPCGVAVDSSGNVYIADTLDSVIRKVTTDGIINTIGGNYFAGYSGDAAAATSASLNHPQDVAVDNAGTVYIADTLNGYIREITSDGNINYIAGDGALGYSGDGLTAVKAGLIEPFAITIDSSGNYYIAERADGRIRKVDSKGIITTVAGTGTLGYAGDNGTATSAQLFFPTGVALDSSGNLYIADSLNNRVRKLSGTTITTVAGNGGYSYSGDNGAATKAQLNSAQAVAADSAGNFYIADTANHVVRKVAANGTISTIAGTGTAGYGGDNGTATSAQLNSPAGVAVDSNGNVYVSDTANSRVRKISGTTISTVAGNGTPGYAGDGAAATSAQVNFPVGLAVDSAGNLYIADTSNSTIRKVSTGGTITTVAGNGRQGFSGDQNPATAAQLNDPQAVAVDSSGNLYIADTGNNRVRAVATNGTITTLAGNGLAGYSGDGGRATAAQFASPSGIAVDAAGNVYVTDASAYVRKVYFNGIVTTIAGNGSQGYSGDGGLALSATLNRPNGLAVDSKGNLYLADSGNSAIRLLQLIGATAAISAVTNGASNTAGSIAPGEVVVLYGSAMGPSQVVQYQLANGLVPTTVGGTSVLFNGQPAPVLYSSATQVGAIVPFGITGSSAQVYVTYQGVPSPPTTKNVAKTAPALFTLDGSGKGQAAAVNQDGSINGAAHPADSTKYISLYGTGFGQTNPTSQDGQPATTPLPQVSLPTATIGGKTATVSYAGGAVTLINGVIQINVQIPAGLTAGNAEIVLQAGGVSSPSGVTVAVSGQ